MRGISLNNNLIFYFGSPAGYLEKGIAKVDPIFRNEPLTDWLAAQNIEAMWTDGVFELLISGVHTVNTDDTEQPMKAVRIWQLRPDASAWTHITTFGKPIPDPNIREYIEVYNGQFPSNELEEIYDRFSQNPPSGFTGHPLSVGDIVELYDESGRRFYFLDRTRFREVRF